MLTRSAFCCFKSYKHFLIPTCCFSLYNLRKVEPKFQSSFIPKNPAVAGAPAGLVRREGKNLFSFLSLVIFIISVVLAAGTFGYKYYLKYSIGNMGADLERARAALSSEVIDELVRLDNRIISTENLISRHRVLTPLFEFLEVSTPQTVRFNDFQYSVTDRGFELSMRGEARGYEALAFQAEAFNSSRNFKDPVFSDLRLNERGDVGFSFQALVGPELVSYGTKLIIQDNLQPE